MELRLAGEGAADSWTSGNAAVSPEGELFPRIIVAQQPRADEAGVSGGTGDVLGTSFPRELLHKVDVGTYVAEHGLMKPRSSFGSGAWSLDPGGQDDLMAKIGRAGAPLSQFVGSKAFYGVKTGLNQAFLIDGATRARLITSDAGGQPRRRGHTCAGRTLSGGHPNGMACGLSCCARARTTPGPGAVWGPMRRTPSSGRCPRSTRI